MVLSAQIIRKLKENHAEAEKKLFNVSFHFRLGLFLVCSISLTTIDYVSVVLSIYAKLSSNLLAVRTRLP